MSPSRSCLLVDDSRAILDALAQLLAAEGFEPVAVAETASRGLDLLSQGSFDVVILDYRLPDISGLEFAELAASLSASPIVFYTSYADPSFVLRALEVGARAVVLKDAPPANLLQALETVLEGYVYLDPRLALGRRHGAQ